MELNNLDREIFFPISEAPIFADADMLIPIEDKKALLHGTSYDYISTVGKGYGVIPNISIVSELEKQLVNYFDPIVTDRVEVKDYVSPDYRMTLSEYIFPTICERVTTSTGHSTEVGLRFILKNTFDGSSSLVLYGGMIDFFCTNGMILGKYDVMKARHTRNFSVDGFFRAFNATMENYNAQVAEYQAWANRSVSSVDVMDMFNRLTRPKDKWDEAPKRSGGLGNRLFSQYMEEAGVRGYNVFTAQSALTHYASHDDSRFPLTKNGNDGSLFKRQEKVATWMNSHVWKEFSDPYGSLLPTS